MNQNLVVPIPITKYVNGAELCRDYSINLAMCALENFEKYPTVSFSLMILALEEVGKGIILLKNFEQGNELSETKLTDHLEKLKAVHTVLIDPYSFLKPHELSVRLKEEKKFFQGIEPSFANQIYDIKLDCLYVNWNENKNRWEAPMQNRLYSLAKTFEICQSAIGLLSEKIREVQNFKSA